MLGMADTSAQSSQPSSAPRLVKCVKLQKELPGLEAPPWPGEIGQRVYENVSAQAWKMWEDRQKMILNEYRLMPWQKEAQEMLARQMEEFFFGAGAGLPPGYVPEGSDAKK
jgi:Fe-S cluster biosynthesis and repair protein YggX